MHHGWGFAAQQQLVAQRQGELDGFVLLILLLVPIGKVWLKAQSFPFLSRNCVCS